MPDAEPAAGSCKDDHDGTAPRVRPGPPELALTEADLGELRKPPLRFREFPLGDGLRGFVLMREGDARDPAAVFRERLLSCQKPSGGTKDS